MNYVAIFTKLNVLISLGCGDFSQLSRDYSYVLRVSEDSCSIVCPYMEGCSSGTYASLYKRASECLEKKAQKESKCQKAIDELRSSLEKIK